MVNTHSQRAYQQQEPYDETYQETQPIHRSHRSSREISRRGTPQEIEDTLNELRKHLMQLMIPHSSHAHHLPLYLTYLAKETPIGKRKKLF